MDRYIRNTKGLGVRMPAKSRLPRILIVEDNDLFREVISVALRLSQFEVVAVPGCVELVSLVEEFRPDVVVIDWMLRSDQNGADIGLVLKSQFPDLKLVLITGHTGISDSIAASNEAFVDTVYKPFHTCEFLDSIHRAMQIDN
ncbi:response regulator [bacterium]|nr:response regulator [bacterium]